MISYEQLKNGTGKIAVVGLGYVGLPLAVALSGHFKVIGFDVKSSRVEELKKGIDRTHEVNADKLAHADIEYSDEPFSIREADVIIVAVPTPIDQHRNPDLASIRSASELVGKNLKQGAVVVYESTVYPGLTEELCVPILENASGLKYGQDFTIGYSPERINPGDKVHTLETTIKVVSANDSATLNLLAEIYGSIVKAGVHRASSIKVAEAAKIIENTQRDLNIALMNELAIIFEKMGIDTLEVLEAAGTKWNFLSFRPGLVGGHCIGVDPYYLTFKAEAVGFHPNVILAGRRINDGMGRYVAETVIKKLACQNVPINGARVGILGLTFKENVPDLRNSQVINIISALEEYGVYPLVHDPEADRNEAQRIYGRDLIEMDQMRSLDALILAVGHAAYSNMDIKSLRRMFRNPDTMRIFDVKGFFPKDEMLSNEVDYWRL